MRFYDAQTGETAESTDPANESSSTSYSSDPDDAIDAYTPADLQGTDDSDTIDSVTGTPDPVPDTRPTFRLIREARAPKLSLRSNGSLTYQVLTDEARSGVWLRIAVNHEGGCFSDEAVPLAAILDCVRELRPDAALQALSFKSAFIGRSTCNGGFLAAVLLAEGLLGRDPTRPQRLVDTGRWSDWSAQQLDTPGELPCVRIGKAPAVNVLARASDVQDGDAGPVMPRVAPFAESAAAPPTAPGRGGKRGRRGQG